jgi:hypothetical protein
MGSKETKKVKEKKADFPPSSFALVKSKKIAMLKADFLSFYLLRMMKHSLL